MAPPLNAHSPGWCVWPWEITPHITIAKLCSWGGLVEMGPAAQCTPAILLRGPP